MEETDPLNDEAPDLGWTVAKLVGEKVEGKETAEGALDLMLSVTCSNLSTSSSGSALRHCNTPQSTESLDLDHHLEGKHKVVLVVGALETLHSEHQDPGEALKVGPLSIHEGHRVTY